MFCLMHIDVYYIYYLVTNHLVTQIDCAIVFVHFVISVYLFKG
jgi:hypothetical protein